MITEARQQAVFDATLGVDADQPITRLGGMSRREMMKFCAGVAATMGLSQVAGVRMALAAENPKRPPVIWLHGQECTGCTESLLRAYHPTLETLLLDVISLDYHDTLCVGAGKQALDYKHKIMNEYRGKYILVTEGGTPMADGGIYCKVGGKTQVELVREAAEGAAAIIAIGSCAAWGGVQSATPNPTGAVGTHEVIPGKTVINVPGCPPNPYNFLSTVLHILTFGEPPALDELNRPKFAYGRIIHENCERRPHFDAGRFALEFGDAGHRQGFCLYKIGCKGPETHANCPAIGFGDVGEGNWPVGIGAPCFGCTEKGVGFTKPIHSLATLKAQTPPSLYPSIDGARGGGASPGAAALVGGVVGVALGAGAVFVKRMAEERDRDNAATKAEPEREG
ncbi:MAG: hydrogenase 2 small subunit [Gammaproteobacteria bacterium HGW-Gammaproteobacteria-2]|jgi:hydrogenase small subunit|nr:MAG: hydrogenase 2 small subunit [Gammaproteobacteria bacterium HGW-Gammaproteobacteria-2]